MKKIDTTREPTTSLPDHASVLSASESKSHDQPTREIPDTMAASTSNVRQAGLGAHVEAEAGQSAANALIHGLARPVAATPAKASLGEGNLDSLRWATAFAHFWRDSSLEIGVPFTPLFESMCQRAADDRDTATLTWLIGALREPLAEPLDEDAPDPCKALMIQCIARSLCAMPSHQAAPLWQKLLDRLEGLVDDSFDFAYSIEVLTKVSPHIADESIRQTVRQRLHEATQHLPAEDANRRDKLVAGLIQDEQNLHTPLVAKKFPPSALPEPLASLASAQALETSLMAIDTLPPHSKTRSNAARDVFIAASMRHDEPLLSDVVQRLCDTACTRGDAYLVLDAFNWMVDRSAPEAADGIRNTYVRCLKDAPREAQSPLLRSVALVLPTSAKELVVCAKILLPWLNPATGNRPSDGQMDVWCFLAKHGLVAELLSFVDADARR